MVVFGKRFYRVTVVVSSCVFLACNPYAFARIINLPEEYPSIQEAVEAAVSGDEIHVNQHDVCLLNASLPDGAFFAHVGILVREKDLSIVGTAPDERVRVKTNGFLYYDRAYPSIPPQSEKNALIIDGSNVILKNLVFDCPRMDCMHLYSCSAPVQIISGKLTLDNVNATGSFKVQGDLEIRNSVVSCNGYVRTNDYHWDPFKNAVPAIYVYGCNSPSIEIVDSEIDCNTDVGARAVTFDGASGVRARFENTSIESGCQNGSSFSSTDGRYWIKRDETKGLAGVFVVNCTNAVFAMTGSETIGDGKNYDTNKPQRKRNPGGPGIEIANCRDVTIQGGRCIGGEGAQGQMGIDIDEWPQKPVHSGDGGCGLFITNSSVFLNQVTAIGGRGGEGVVGNGIEAGADGAPIYYDGDSTVVFGSGVEDWAIYR